MIFGKHINKYYLRYLPALLFGIAALVLVDFMQLKVPEIYRTVVNGLNGEIDNFDMDYLLDSICRPLIFVIMSLVVCRFVWRICFFGTAVKVEKNLRSELFAHCFKLSPKFYDENKVGDLMSLFTNDLETVQDCFGGGILMLADAITMGLMALYKMFRMNGYLALFSLIPMIILFALSTFIGKKMTKKWDDRQAAFSKLSDFSQESFSGFAVIKAFVIEMKECCAFEKLNRKNEDANVKYVKVSTLLNITVTLFVETVSCIIFGFGGYLVKKQVFNAGQLIEFIGYFNAIIWPIMAVSELIDMTSRGKASLSRVEKLLDEVPDMQDSENAEAPNTTIQGKIEFKNLTFTYPGAAKESISNACFTILPGESVGIIGKTGCGKTTICDLIMRAYNVSRGMLFIDDKDVCDLSIEYVRKGLAYVPQDNFLFSDTIRNNIAFASETDDMENVKESAEISCVAKDVEDFPLSYETILGERGVTVSGGQKQRISIARAIMKDAPILVLDDSVSAVDVDTEAKILDALKETRKGKTTILIAHRVSTVKSMDKIIYMEDGKIVAIGTHEELCKTCAAYNKTASLQAFEDEKAGELNA